MNTLLLGTVLLSTPAADYRGGYERRDYEACVRAVETGEEVFLAIGVTPEPDDYSCPDLKKDDGTYYAPGRYKCWRVRGGRLMQWQPPPPPPVTHTPLYQYTPFLGVS